MALAARVEACQIDEWVHDAGPYDSPVPPGVVIRAYSAWHVPPALIEVGEGDWRELPPSSEPAPPDWASWQTPDDLPDGSYRVEFEYEEGGRGTLVIDAVADVAPPDGAPALSRLSVEAEDEDPGDTGAPCGSGAPMAEYRFVATVPAAASPGWVFEVLEGDAAVEWMWLPEGPAEVSVTHRIPLGVGQVCFTPRIRDPFGEVHSTGDAVCEQNPGRCGCGGTGMASTSGAIVAAMVAARRRAKPV
ncbi:MAG: hypothetical protein ACOZNI_17795 [Myxococcota bacterium]